MKIQPSDLNESIRKIPLPDLMRDRPVSKQGYPVPFFAGKNKEGEWDFRVVPTGRQFECHKKKLCWVCGKTMGPKMSFVVGPMCVVTHTSAEPPCHYSCAQYSAIACPFLAMPRMKRNEKDLPVGHLPPAGKAIMRNPGVAAVLVTRSYKIFNDGAGGGLFEMGPPEAVEWYARRGLATYTDVSESIQSGLQFLLDECEAQPGGPEQVKEAHEELHRRLNAVTRWMPQVTAAEIQALGATAVPRSTVAS